jgi:hypothetical protein
MAVILDPEVRSAIFTEEGKWNGNVTRISDVVYLICWNKGPGPCTTQLTSKQTPFLRSIILTITILFGLMRL